MPNHKLLSFSKLHKAKFDSGDAADLPLVPEGKGDIYWAPDDDTIYIANFAGTAWNTYEMGGTGGGTVSKLDNVGDVNASTPSNDQILYFDTATTEWKAKTLPNFLTDFKLSKLVDASITSAAKGDIIAYTGSAWQNLVVGSNKQVLQADSTQSTGVKWTVLDLADTVGSYINMVNQSVNPATTPASGKTFIFVKTNDLYLKKSDGSIIGPFLTTASNGSLDDLLDVVITSAAKGNVLIHNGTNWVNMGVGTNGQVLTANSAATNGADWENPTSATIADFELMVWLDLV